MHTPESEFPLCCTGTEENNSELWRNGKISVDKNNGHLIGFAWFQIQCKDCNSSNNFHNYSPENQLTMPVMKLYFYI